MSETPKPPGSLAARNYHVGYNAEEDRLLISVEVEANQEYAMSLTRRLTKMLIGTLADLQVKKKVAELEMQKPAANPEVRKKLETATRNSAVRDTVLNFEHSHAIAASVAAGDTRPRKEAKPLVAAPRLIREVKITPKTDGGALITLNNDQKVLALDLNAQRVHSFMAGIIELSDKAGWNLPLIATWLDRAAGKVSEPSNAVH